MITKKLRGYWPVKMLRSGEEGSALVEFGLSLPVLAIMLLGAAEFARLAYASIEVANGAHAAVMYAASSQAASSDTGGITNAANSDASNLTGGITVSGVTTTCACADTTYTPTSCSDNSTCVSNNTSMVTSVTVQTQATFTPLIRRPGGPSSYTLHGTSTQMVSNE
jgi:Flp pilus assembly protein TadG